MLGTNIVNPFASELVALMGYKNQAYMTCLAMGVLH